MTDALPAKRERLAGGAASEAEASCLRYGGTGAIYPPGTALTVVADFGNQVGGANFIESPAPRRSLSQVDREAGYSAGKTTPRKNSAEAPRLLAGKTRWNVHGAMHAFVGWLADEDRRVNLPGKWPWPKKDESSPTLISIETQEAIPDARRGLFLAMAYLGIRPGEAVALDTTDYRDGWLTISKARKGERITAPTRGTKTGVPKRLPVPDELAVWVERHHDKRSLLRGGTLFPNPGAYNVEKRWSASAMRRAWSAGCAEVGATVALYSGTKHSTAAHLLSRGAPERQIQKLLGHADIRSTRRYAKLQDTALVDLLKRRKR